MNRKIRIFLAGDSTVAAYGCRQRPMTGWGQLLREYFTRKVEVRNYAMCGRSSRTFIEEGRLARIEREIAPGDYLLIQFGHNDATMEKPERYVKPYDEFAGFLRQYIRTARDRQATPVLVTPMQRRNFAADGHLIWDHRAYIETMRRVAKEENVALLDLSTASGEVFEHAGSDRTKQFFFHYDSGWEPNYPQGAADNTHFQREGARLLCNLLVGELEKSNLPLKDQLIRRKPVRVWMAGDSTMADYGGDEEPMSGWGQQLWRFFDDGVEIHNQAVCGKSSKSFIHEGYLGQIFRCAMPEDYLIIQFAHNDEKLHYANVEEEFQSYLRQYIEGARACQIRPILVTPIERRQFDEKGRLRRTHEPYVQAMKELASREDVPLIDMNEETHKLFESAGPETCKQFFMYTAKGAYPNYPDGNIDDTHFREKGAILLAKLFAEKLQEQMPHTTLARHRFPEDH